MRPVFVCATAVFTVAGTIVGQILVQRHYEQQRFHLDAETVHALLEEKEGIRLYPVPLTSEDDLSGFASANDADFLATAGEAEATDADGPVLPAVDTIALFDGPQPVAEPDPESSSETSTESVEVEIRITDKESDASPAAPPLLEAPLLTGPKLAELLPAHPPAELSAPMNAAPLTISKEERDRIRAIIRAELPKASQDEQDIWLEQLQGMSPQMIHELLRMRKLFSIEQPLADDPSELPPLGPFEEPVYDGPTNSFSGEFSGDVVSSSTTAIRFARDVVLNNIANANTIGFKRSIVHFEDLPDAELLSSGSPEAGASAATQLTFGIGMEVGGVVRDHSQGPLEETGRSLDLAIDGEGYFQVRDEYSLRYTRAGRFVIDPEGQLAIVNPHGKHMVEPRIVFPEDARDIQVSETGIVSVLQGNETERTEIGQIKLARFLHPASLKQAGANLFHGFVDRVAIAPKALVGDPCSEGRGRIRQCFLESSNVDVQAELQALKKLKRQLTSLKQAKAILPEEELRILETRIIYGLPAPEAEQMIERPTPTERR